MKDFKIDNTTISFDDELTPTDELTPNGNVIGTAMRQSDEIKRRKVTMMLYLRLTRLSEPSARPSES